MFGALENLAEVIVPAAEEIEEVHTLYLRLVQSGNGTPLVAPVPSPPSAHVKWMVALLRTSKFEGPRFSLGIMYCVFVKKLEKASVRTEVFPALRGRCRRSALN